MRTLFMALLTALIPATASIAAPFDCTKLLGSGAGPGGGLAYQMNRYDRVAKSELFIGFTSECGLHATGLINDVSGRGLITTTHPNVERYVATVRGNLGSSLFDRVFTGPYASDGVSPLEGTISYRPPDHRINFAPEGGRNLGFFYPNGFSLTLDCPPLPLNNCGSFEGPFYLIDGTDGVVEFIGSNGGPYELGTIPLPPALPMALAALAGLGLVGGARRSA